MNTPQHSPRNLFFFLLIAFGISWAFWVPQALIAHGWNAPGWLSWLVESPLNQAAFGPSIAAVVLISINGGLGGVGRFLKDGLTRSFNLWLLIPALFLFPAICAAALAIALGPTALVETSPAFTDPLQIPLTFLWILLLGGPLQEEFGWRGYLMPRMQSRRSGLVAALIVGFIWAIWHFPLNFAGGAEGPQYTQAPQILIGSIITLTIVSILIGWIYNAGKGSVLLALLMHASLNLSTFFLFPVFNHPEALPFYTGLILLAAIIVVIAVGPRKLGRQTF